MKAKTPPRSNASGTSTCPPTCCRAYTATRIRERLEGALKAAAHRRIIATERGEMYLLTRSIDDYTLDECVQFLLATMRSSGGPAVWDRDEAIKLTASYLGFRRTGSRVTAALKSAINAGIRRGQLARDQNSIRIARDLV